MNTTFDEVKEFQVGDFVLRELGGEVFTGVITHVLEEGNSLRTLESDHANGEMEGDYSDIQARLDITLNVHSSDDLTLTTEPYWWPL